MTIDATSLMAGPRGRRVCFEYALLCAERSLGTHEPASDTQRDPTDAATALRRAVSRLNPRPGVLLSIGPQDPNPAADPVVTPADAASAFDSFSIPAPTDDDLRSVIATAVDSARYWQEPDGEDALAATSEMRRQLVGVAGVLAASPQAVWWAAPVDLDDQWAVPWEGGGAAPGDADALLASWRDRVFEDEECAARERPTDPHSNWSGMWWSIPSTALVHSTRSLADAGPARLWWEEDSLGPEEAFATPVDAYPARVLEIDGADAWADLCRRHPLEVSASRRHDWFRTTGRVGRWVMPDWSRVAAEADGVHLTVAGYLAAAGRAIDVSEDTASVIAGWNPDETYWFRSTSARPADGQRWVRGDDDLWRRSG